MEESEQASRTAAKEFVEAWSIITKAVDHYRKIYMPYVFVEGVPQRMPLGFQSHLAAIAKTLVRASEELTKPDSQRLREYTEANLPALKQTLIHSGADPSRA